MYIFGISNPLLTQFPCDLRCWPEKPFCKDVHVCKYSSIYGLCWGKNTTESQKHSSLIYGMNVIYCRNIPVELKPTAGKFGLSMPKPALCLLEWINLKNILLHKWELLKPPFHLHFLHPMPSQLCCLGVCE